MEVNLKLTDVLPNPFRRIERYPLDPDTLQALRATIRDSRFSRNTPVREHEEGFQLCYGHHRIAAAKLELGPDHGHLFPIEEDVNDDEMLRMMAYENSDDWGSNNMVLHMLNVVGVTKERLEGMNPAELIRVIPNIKHSQGFKETGEIGKYLLKKYLRGTYASGTRIEHTLSFLNWAGDDQYIPEVRGLANLHQLKALQAGLEKHHSPDKIPQRMSLIRKLKPSAGGGNRARGLKPTEDVKEHERLNAKNIKYIALMGKMPDEPFTQKSRAGPDGDIFQALRQIMESLDKGAGALNGLEQAVRDDGVKFDPETSAELQKRLDHFHRASDDFRRAWKAQGGGASVTKLEDRRRRA